MILPDVNVLIYAFDEESPRHSEYAQWLERAVNDPEDIALFDPVLSGFVRIVTHPRVFTHPAPTPVALSFVTALVNSHSARWLRSSPEMWNALSSFVDDDDKIKGNMVPDALIAAAAVVHGAKIATADRGFSRFPGVISFDPAR
ncbi:TA system VapC family ribonuclease toxin [Paramicrobacterium fandaimingii]|uniref:TA system VapC family ribonuclease toxin n=1 Tax=Paramicrobacterium fandaimingii TaxID=2708079 RepID=UPI00141E48DE|nr:TA system VapC family ribonuclease toxin [Microbacterium fandaimingii]